MYGFAGGIFFGQNYLKKIEEEMKEYFGVKYVFFVSSGKAALFLILRALKKQSSKKNQVIIPAYTCFSVPSAVVKAGLKVAICDINNSTFSFDYDLLKKSINDDTLCVVQNHLFGIPSDTESISILCREKGIFVIEDAAQAMGCTYKNKMLGTNGDVGFFSLGRGKNITCGSGGIIVTNSEETANTLKVLIDSIPSPGIIETLKEFIQAIALSLFIHPSLYWFPEGLPFLKLGETHFYKDFSVKKLSGMQAGLLRGWQKQMEVSNIIRRKNAEYLIKKLESHIIHKLKVGINYLRLPLIIKNNSKIEGTHFLENNRELGIRQMYPTPINEIESIKSQFNAKTFPVAKKVSENLLTLPTHQLLKKRDMDKILESVMSKLRGEPN